MKYKKQFLLILLSTAFLSACGSMAELIQNTTPAPTATEIPPIITQEPEAAEEINLPLTLTIWVPPWLDPSNEEAASQMLLQRLAAFSERHPGVRVEIRVKAESGDAGLFTSLEATSSAAPLALPDLVLLSREDMLAASAKNLIYPMDEYLTAPLAEDWYDFSLQLSQFNESTYSFPALVDGMILVYRQTALEDPPSTWEELLNSTGILGFPAADTQAAFTIAQYLSEIPNIYVENQGYAVDESIMTSILDFYRRGQSSGNIPFWLTQFDSEDSSWQAFIDGRTSMTITWYTRSQQAANSNLTPAPIPTRTGTPFSLVTSWSWSLANNNRSQAELTVQLAQFLTEPEFLAEWSAAAGYLPPRADALALWPNGTQQALASQILPSALVHPNPGELTILGGPFSQAVIEVLKLETEPEQAAQNIIQALTP